MNYIARDGPYIFFTRESARVFVNPYFLVVYMVTPSSSHTMRASQYFDKPCSDSNITVIRIFEPDGVFRYIYQSEFQ